MSVTRSLGVLYGLLLHLYPRRFRDEFSWVSTADETVLVSQPAGSIRWWTFAGGQANVWLASALGGLADQVTPGDLHIRMASGATPEALLAALAALVPEELELGEHVAQGAIDRLKFAEALPERYAREVVVRRMRDDEAVRVVGGWPVRSVRVV